ncbi:MAG: polysaccharide biosynthesis tyrosine autokinase [Anaerolineales bacterium]|nr:polysaccharide biosynthesis tyrosine autokinase [Anaerolineales bacterium]
MEINSYIRPLIRWWRLVVVVTMLAVISSAVSTLFQPALYESRTTLVIGTTILDPNPDSGQIYIAQQLAGIYADMARREPIQQATMNALGITWLPQYQSKVVPNTQMVEISVSDTNPQRAQIIANELARQLMEQSPAIGGTETGVRQEFIRQQLSSLQLQIQDVEKNIEDLQSSLVGLNSASQTSNIQSQIDEQTRKLNSLRESYASFLSNSQKGALNILSVVEPANLPTKSVGTNKLIIIALAGLVGFSLGAGAAYLLEFLDRTVKTTTDVERLFGLPVIGYISEIQENSNNGTYVAENPNSIIAENFRLLRSNIEFFQISNPIRTILVTSPNQGNGKTTVATNLALSISQGEQDVVLVDADLRRPAVHKVLDMSKEPGLSDVIRNKARVDNVVRKWMDDGLKVISAGDIPSNITEVVGSKRIASILGELRDMYELVIVDAPPLIIADSYNLASKVDGVILVMEPGQTTEDQAKTIKEQLDRSNAHLLGIVFNKISEQSAHSYYDYQYRSLYSPRYYGDYISKADKEPNTGSRSKKIMAFFEHGNVPPEVEDGIQSAITAIRTQPRDMVSRIKKNRKNGKASKSDDTTENSE